MQAVMTALLLCGGMFGCADAQKPARETNSFLSRRAGWLGVSCALLLIPDGVLDSVSIRPRASRKPRDLQGIWT